MRLNKILTATAVLERISDTRHLALSTLKFNMNILRGLGLLSIKRGTKVSLSSFGVYVLGILDSNALNARLNITGGEIKVL